MTPGETHVVSDPASVTPHRIEYRVQGRNFIYAKSPGKYPTLGIPVSVRQCAVLFFPASIYHILFIIIHIHFMFPFPLYIYISCRNRFCEKSIYI